MLLVFSSSRFILITSYAFVYARSIPALLEGAGVLEVAPRAI